MSTPEQWPFHSIDVNSSLLPLFIGHCFNWALFGLLCLQIFAYYASFPRDQAHFKWLVYGVFAIDTTSLALATYSGYVVFVQHWGDLDVFHGHLGWSWASVPVSSGFVALIVQTFFAYRIWIISKNLYMVILVILLSTTACGFAIAAAVDVAHVQVFSYIRKMIPSLWLGFGLAADMAICLTLVYYLLRTPSKFKPSRRVIIRLVRISVETAAITMSIALIKLILIYTRHDLMHILFCLLLPRLYTNAMIGTLNSRSPVFGGGQTFSGATVSGSTSGFTDATPGTITIGSTSTAPFSRRSVKFNNSKWYDVESAIDESTEDGQELTYEPGKFKQEYPMSPPTPMSGDTLLSPPLSPPADVVRRS